MRKAIIQEKRTVPARVCSRLVEVTAARSSRLGVTQLCSTIAEPGFSRQTLNYNMMLRACGRSVLGKYKKVKQL